MIDFNSSEKTRSSNWIPFRPKYKDENKQIKQNHDLEKRCVLPRCETVTLLKNKKQEVAKF